jgi:hypothetical protein
VCAVGPAAAGALHRVVRGVVEPLAPYRFGASSAGSPEGSGRARQPDAGVRMSRGESVSAPTGVDSAGSGAAGSAADRVPDGGVAVADPEGTDGRAGIGISAVPTRMARLRREPVWLERWRARVDPAALLAAAGLVAILAADLSGLSKAETERIRLPFDMWVLAGTALLPHRGVRCWLAAQAVAALLINHLLMTNW